MSEGRKWRALVQETDAEKVARYLPENYHVVPGGGTDGETLIEGEDVAGWTMLDYVEPRLNSGLMWINVKATDDLWGDLV